MAHSAASGVRLRRLTLDDIEPIAAQRSSAGEPIEEARTELRKQIEKNPDITRDGFLELGVEAAGELVGQVQARAPRGAFPAGGCEIGITLFPTARGLGYGTEAVVAFVELLLADGWARVQASTACDNLTMRRVLEHCGFGFEGILRSYAPTSDGGREDYAMYAVTSIARSG